MSLRKKLCQVPKTQPTKCSSRTNSDRKIIQYQQFNTCPETSCFNQLDTSLLLKNVDYGKLQQPKYIQIQRNRYKNQLIKEDRQIKKIRQISQSSQQMQTDQFTKRKLPVYKSTQIHRMRDNSLRQLKKCQLIDKKSIVSQSFKQLKKQLSGGQYLNKRLNCKLNEVRAYSNRNNDVKAQRKKIYSRIVKTYVGGGPMKTKIITYPDTSQYKKFCLIK